MNERRNDSDDVIKKYSEEDAEDRLTVSENWVLRLVCKVQK